MKKPIILLSCALFSAGLYAQEVTVLTVTNNDSDGDRIVDTVDVDDDNDGIPDVLEIEENGKDRDSDGDGMPDRLDLDSDNDGILDWKESGALISLDFTNLRVVAGRFVGQVGENGMNDNLESPLDTGQIVYKLRNTDKDDDDRPDFLDLDSDNDGLPDLIEAGVDQQFDQDGDARIDAPPGSVGNDGILDALQTINDASCCDVTGDGRDDSVPLNTDGGDFPDYQDHDSDNDGVSDIIEAGGSDYDRDGMVDNFFDAPVLDGMDDALLSVPLWPGDENGNGVADHLDEFVQAGNAGPTEPDTNVPDATDSDDIVDEGDDTDEGEPEDAAGSETEDDNSDAEPEGESEAATNNSDENSEIQDDEPSLGAAEPQNEEVEAGREPAPRPQLGEPSQFIAEDDPSLGIVRTGLTGGCSIHSTGIDLMLLLMSVLSIAVIGWRYTLRRMKKLPV